MPATTRLDLGRVRQTALYIRGLAGHRPDIPVDPDRLEAAARRRLAPAAFAYLAGGAGVEHTMAANRAAFDRWRLVPRVLRNVGVRDLGVTLFGRRFAAPILLAPLGVLELAHRDADRGASHAAAALGLGVIWSNQASVPMEACARAMNAVARERAPIDEGARWFQLYPSRSEALLASLVRRAELCGCSAVVLTVDTTMLGWRPRDLDAGFLPFLYGMGIAQYTSDPVFRAEAEAANVAAPAGTRQPARSLATLRAAVAQARRYPGSTHLALRTGTARRAVQHFLATYSRPSLTWDDLARLRAMTRLPFLLKGILHPDDAQQVLAAGVDGLIVSNHGGRQVDGAIGALDALPGVVAAVAGRVPVLLDGGIRTGADVCKALALGATAVTVGRPYAYGLALGGTAGAHAVLENLVAEFDLTLGLTGCTSPDALGRDVLVAAPHAG